MPTEIWASRIPLFVPGDRPDRFQKAADSGADAIIIDLEDAVAEADKPSARHSLVSHGVTNAPVIVRMNALETPHAEADIEAISNARLDAVMVAKAADAGALTDLGQRLDGDRPLIALIETVDGLASARAIAAAPGVVQLAFGSADFSVELGCADDWEPLVAARSELVLASALARIAPPLDGVTIAIDDPKTVEADAARAKRHGFGGKLLIHPKQITPARAGFRPSEDEVAWAKKIVRSVGGAETGAVASGGDMVDKPVLARAQRILADHERA